VISKSGNTLETLLNFFALKIVKKNSKNIIIISEKNKGPLHLISEKMKLFYIEHRKNIGGRFSVLTETGIIPALLMGINLPQLRKNLLIHFQTKNKKFLKESSIKLTNLIKNKKFRNLIFLNYVPELDKFLYWNQQLIAESLGKNGIGFLPLISTVPKDHHSLLQLYLDGPRDKIFYIFSMNKNNNFKITAKILGKKLHFLNNKSLNQIKTAQKDALVKVLKKNKIPFREFQIDNDLSEEILGELFSYFMIETAIVGKLAQVNPFNQPAVEQVKINTRRLLN
jgi:glucose-6-phosphate isomerase